MTHHDDHDHGDKRGHIHENGHEHSHEHGHHHGLINNLRHLFTPHSHDAADSIDSALTSSTQGMHALRISLAGLFVTAVLQAVIVAISGSVALLADTIHNFADALTAIPLGLAFWAGTRKANRRYTYGYGRLEDLAGVFIIAVISLSAIVAAWEAIRRLTHPQTVNNLGWVIAAGFVGFFGNELVARYRIRVGQQIGSAALIADGYHARVDGFTSLAVVAGAIGVALGLKIADPLAGLLITIAILVVLRGAVRDIYRRLMDAVDPEIVAQAQETLRHVNGVTSIESLRMRWIGHRLHLEAELAINSKLSFTEAHEISHDAEHRLLHDVAKLATANIAVSPDNHIGHDPHRH